MEALNGLELLGAGSGFRDELCTMLSESALFGDLPWADIEVLARYVQAYSAAADVVLFREGDPGSFLCLVVSGRVAIDKTDSQDEHKTVTLIGPGKALGEMAVIDGERRSAACITRVPSTLVLLTKEHFNRILAEHPGLAAQILLRLARLLSQRLRFTSGQLVDYLHT